MTGFSCFFCYNSAALTGFSYVKVRLQAGGVDEVFLGVFVDAEVEQR